MVSVYNFGQEEQELLAEIMEPENLSLLGYSENGGSGSPGAGILPEQYQAVLDSVSDENGRKVLEFALSKVDIHTASRCVTVGHILTVAPLLIMRGKMQAWTLCTMAQIRQQRKDSIVMIITCLCIMKKCSLGT